MAIRYPMNKVGGLAQSALTLAGDVWSGWRVSVIPPANGANDLLCLGFQSSQPSRMSRPGNLGTAYTGAWTNNISG